MTALRLEDLKGVGPQLAAALRRRFGGDEAVLEAARRLDVEALSAVDGVSERRALDWIRQVEGHADDDAFLATPGARRIHDAILDRVQSFASTAHGRNRLRLLRPLPDPAIASAHAAQVMAHRNQAAALDRLRVRQLLKRVRAPVEPAPRLAADRILVCADPATEDRLRGLGAHRWVHVGGREELRHADSYPLVVVAGGDGIADALDHAVEADGLDLVDVAPESEAAWFAANRATLESCAALAGMLGRPQRAGEALRLLEEWARLDTTPADLRAAVAAVQEEAGARLRERLAGVQLRGDEVLDALGERLPARIREALAATLAEARASLRARTGVDFQPFPPALPLAADDAEVERVERGLDATGHRRAFEARVRIARSLARLRDAVRTEAAHWLDFDAAFALGCFALEHGLAPARWGSGVAFRDSLHLDLADRPGAQRISYAFGDPARAILLTGANSGGKTTLLEHIAQLVVLARLGLPVPGDAELPWVEELHVVTARRGLDAGAFETFLRGFLPVAERGRGSLVLADEVEAVTELAAASRILAFFLERVARQGGLAVVATHMAPEIVAQLEPGGARDGFRIDGIEASGLDGQGRLVVDRAPRAGHLARSTPELIVQRLALAARGAERSTFQDLLARLQAGGRKGQTTAPASPAA